MYVYTAQVVEKDETLVEKESLQSHDSTTKDNWGPEVDGQLYCKTN